MFGILKKLSIFKKYSVKDEIDKEMDLYRRWGLLNAKEEIAQARNALKNEWSKIEHDYHSAKQAKETEIARLDALIDAKKAILEQDNATCHFLKGIITELAKNQK